MSQLQKVAPEDVHPHDIEIYQQLAKLQSMYNQASELRTLLPDRLVEPTRFARQAPPEKVAVQLRGAATSGSVQIKNFKKAYQSDEMRSLWQTVNNAEFPQGEDVWAVDYAGSHSNTKTLNGADISGSANNAAEGESGPRPVSATIAKFRDAHPALPINTPGGPDVLPIELTVSSMAFQISQHGAADKHVYSVTAMEGAKPSALQLSILQHIAVCHQQEDLPVLVELLASYSNVMNTQCQKCHKVFDQSLKLPIARERENSATDEGKMAWRVLHEACT